MYHVRKPQGLNENGMFWEAQHGYGEKEAKEKLYVSDGQIMKSSILHIKDMGLSMKGTQEITEYIYITLVPV